MVSDIEECKLTIHLVDHRRHIIAEPAIVENTFDVSVGGKGELDGIGLVKVDGS
jgi:hypothetical protein